MNKFKVGDSVVVIENVRQNGNSFKGYVGIVQSKGSQYSYDFHVKFPSPPQGADLVYPFYESELEDADIYHSPLYKALS
jgi:ATP-dependent exoDNAse (exonuclease V) alpha subunit